MVARGYGEERDEYWITEDFYGSETLMVDTSLSTFVTRYITQRVNSNIN